jgi:heme exporter protein A
MGCRSDIVLDVDEIAFSYGYWRVIESCSFEVASGELVHVTGANGVGKTTLMSLIAGLLQPVRGQIRLRKQAGGEIGPRQSHLEYLAAESNGLFGKLDAMENLAFWGGLKGRDVKKDSLTGLLADWGFFRPEVYTGFAVEKFSTGMKRRLALARVVLAGASLWLLDEPCNGLDAKGRAAFERSLGAHLERGGMALVVSHDGDIFGGLTPRRLSL